MSGLHTVVAATDLSPASAPALVRAHELAERTGAALHLVFAQVVFRADGSGRGSPAESVLRLRMERFAADTLGLGTAGLDALAPEMAVVRGLSAPEALAAYAARADADLLVLGTHGRTGLGRLLLGSVAEACVGRAPCPVLTVPSQATATAPGPLAPILVPVDFSDRSRAALSAAEGLAARYEAPVEVVHVVRDSGMYPDLIPDYVTYASVDAEAAERLRQRLHRMAPTAQAIHILMGSASRVIAHLANSVGAGLLVMGTHGRRGAAHALMGSIAEATLRRAPCSVLTLRAADIASPKRPTRSSATALP